MTVGLTETQSSILSPARAGAPLDSYRPPVV